jgi:hypothetical protein
MPLSKRLDRNARRRKREVDKGAASRSRRSHRAIRERRCVPKVVTPTSQKTSLADVALPDVLRNRLAPEPYVPHPRWNRTSKRQQYLSEWKSRQSSPSPVARLLNEARSLAIRRERNRLPAGPAAANPNDKVVFPVACRNPIWRPRVWTSIALRKRPVELPNGPDPSDRARGDLRGGHRCVLRKAAPMASHPIAPAAIVPKVLGLSGPSQPIDPNQPVGRVLSTGKEKGCQAVGRVCLSGCPRVAKARAPQAAPVANPNLARNERRGVPRANLLDQPD